MIFYVTLSLIKDVDLLLLDLLLQREVSTLL